MERTEYRLIEMVRKFLPNQNLKKQVLTNYELRRMRKLVNHAFHKSEFYHRLYKQHGITEKDIPSLHFKDIPIVTKKDISENTQQVFTDPRLNVVELLSYIDQKDSKTNSYKKKYFCFTTSGSLGTKLLVVYSAKEWQKVLNNMYEQIAPPRDRKLKIAGIVRTSGTSPAITLFRSISTQDFDVKELSVLSPLEDIIKDLNDFQPDRLASYPGLFLAMLPYKKNGTLRISPEMISLGGEILTPENQKEISDLFQAPVQNSYGASEALTMATKNVGDTYFKMYPEYSKLEVLNENNEHVQPGESGKVVVTNFINYTQPFIRYALGDIATFGINERGEPCIQEIVSRSYRAVNFQKNCGAQLSIHPSMLCETLWFVPGIEKSQIILGQNEIQTRVVGSEQGIENATKKFNDFLCEQKLDKNVKFTINRVNAINPEPNGKIPFIKYA